jgi:hypothetical protein
MMMRNTKILTLIILENAGVTSLFVGRGIFYVMMKIQNRTSLKTMMSFIDINDNYHSEIQFNWKL